jgi:hypothetical protein
MKKLGNNPIKRVAKRLFGSKNTVNAHKLYPDAYFRRYYLSRAMSEGIDFMAKANRTSKIAMVNELIERGMKDFYVEKISLYNKLVLAARELNQPIPSDHFIKAFIKFAKEQGYDIGKFM